MCFDPFLYWLQVRSTNFCDRNQFLELRALDMTIAHEEFRCLQFELLPPGTNDNSPFIEERDSKPNIAAFIDCLFQLCVAQKHSLKPTKFYLLRRAHRSQKGKKKFVRQYQSMANERPVACMWKNMVTRNTCARLRQNTLNSIVE